MADSTITSLSSYDQILANHEKYADKFADANAEMVNSETFLNLLVAEMTNQDPLEPTSNTEFVSQMAQFTQLSYAQDSSTYAKANYAASLVGKTATASKADGAEQLTKTGVVQSVVKSGDSYTVLIDGVSFDISKVTSVSETVSTTDTSTDSIISTGSALGDTIARASMMIGMYATVSATTDSGDVYDAGVIDSIQVKNGEVNVVIGGIGYKLSDVIEVRYPDYDYGTTDEEVEAADTVTETAETTEVVDSVTDTDVTATQVADTTDESDIVDEIVYEMLEELMADIQQDEDVEDLEDFEDIEETEQI